MMCVVLEFVEVMQSVEFTIIDLFAVVHMVLVEIQQNIVLLCLQLYVVGVFEQ